MANALPYSQLQGFANAVKFVCGAVADVAITTPHLCVQRTTTGTIAIASTAGADIVGVIQDKPRQGEEACVMDDGDTPVYASAACNPGDALMVDATGKVTPATGTNKVVGHCVTGCANANSQITMHLAV